MTTPIETAMVLAAGLGTRMRPLTETRPKPLVVLNGKALVDHVLDKLAEAGVTRAVVNVHHFADLLEAHVRRRAKPQIVVSDEREAVLETGGGIVRALPLLGSAPFLIVNSDAVWLDPPAAIGEASNIVRLLAAWDGERMDALLLVTPREAMLGYDGRGDFSLDDAGGLTRRPPESPAPLVFTGLSIAHPRLFDRAPAGKHSLNVEWNGALAQGRLYGVMAVGTWMHVGTPAGLADAERCMLTATGR